MTERIKGGCRCGAVRYDADPARMSRPYACHCLDCQTWSGSAFSLQLLLPEDALAVTGPVVLYELTSPSGRLSLQRMCGVCHTRIFNTNSSRPGLAALRAGTLDNSDRLDVAVHIWTKRKQPWISLPADAPAWLESAPPAEFMAALAAPRSP